MKQYTRSNCNRRTDRIWKDGVKCRACKVIGGEVINGDAMQVYKDLILEPRKLQKRKWMACHIIYLM